MALVAVSGCATGIGAAVRATLEAAGSRVIGIDLRDAEVCADLSTSEGREAAIAALREACSDRLDGLVLCAGIGGHTGDPEQVVSLNYFGAVVLLDALLPALQAGERPAALAICSNSAQLAPGIADWPVVEALLADDEPRARTEAKKIGGQAAYIGSKNALGQAVRRRAGAWGERGVRLNAVAPGTTRTPLVESALETPDGNAIRAFPVPLGRWAEPADIARVVAFLMSAEAGFVHGAVWYVDGGSDALVRPERF